MSNTKSARRPEASGPNAKKNAKQNVVKDDVSMREKLDLIYEHERVFANRLSGAVIKLPQVGIWMILIPIIFVFHFFQLQRASNGRKDFVQNYLITRSKTLDETCAALEESRTPDIATLAQSDDVPDAIRHHYEAWLKILAEYYATLLRAKGGSFEDLVRNGYRNKKTYRETLRRLNDAEMRFNGAIKPLLPDNVDGANGIIDAMERSSVLLRKEQAEEIFA